MLQQEHGPDWEFKVMQGMGLAFASREKMQSSLEQEARAGWELAGKLSDGRIMLRRPISAREQDALLPEGMNPYRTNTGGTTIILGIILALTLGMVLFTILLMVAAR